MKTRLILVRHAEAEGNFRRLFHGWTDSPITEKGHLQAKQVAEKLRDIKIDIIYSSTLKRTLQTAQYIADVKDLPIIRTDKLKEINGGDWEDRKWDDLPLEWPEEYDTWENKPHIHKMPNGESMEGFQARLLKEIKQIVKDNKGKVICLVTHGTAIKTLLCRFYNCTLEEMLRIPWHENTSVTIVDYEDGEFKVVVEGDASHLDSDMSTIRNQDWWIDNSKKLEDIDNNGIDSNEE